MGTLYRSVRWSRHQDVKAEIERGADVNESNANCSLLEIAVQNADVSMVEILIRAGADVNQGHPNTGRRPLHSAVSLSDLRILELLLNAGADVEGCHETATPLCIAASFGRREAYDRLIEAGANPMATMNGKVASALLASGVAAAEWMRKHREMDSNQKAVDKYEQVIRKMMEEYPTVEEYAAHRGRNIYLYDLDQGVFTDPAVEKWARDLGVIIRSLERLELCEEQFQTGDELEKARRERRNLKRRLAREEARKERITLAAEGSVTTGSES